MNQRTEKPSSIFAEYPGDYERIFIGVQLPSGTIQTLRGLGLL